MTGFGNGLILTRRPGEAILIGDDVRVTLLSIEPGRVRLSIKAPEDVLVLREELEPVDLQKLESLHRIAARATESKP